MSNKLFSIIRLIIKYPDKFIKKFNITDSDIERFWKKVDKTHGFGPNGTCWKWISHTSKNYGLFCLNNKEILAHRFAYITTYNKIPISCVLHTCDNTLCVNPKHLFEGTQLMNMKDCKRKGRHRSIRGENNHFSKLIEKKSNYYKKNI